MSEQGHGAAGAVIPWHEQPGFDDLDIAVVGGEHETRDGALLWSRVHLCEYQFSVLIARHLALLAERERLLRIEQAARAVATDASRIETGSAEVDAELVLALRAALAARSGGRVSAPTHTLLVTIVACCAGVLLGVGTCGALMLLRRWESRACRSLRP